MSNQKKKSNSSIYIYNFTDYSCHDDDLCQKKKFAVVNYLILNRSNGRMALKSKEKTKNMSKTKSRTMATAYPEWSIISISHDFISHQNLVCI